MSTDAARLYRIRHDQEYFSAGVLPNGEQLLFGPQPSEAVIVSFSRDGDFVRCEANIDLMDIVELTKKLRSEARLKPSPIDVRRFFIQDRWIGIRDLPEHYQNVLDHPETFGEDRRRELTDDIATWRDRGDFVLYWNEDYYLDRNGNVISS